MNRIATGIVFSALIVLGLLLPVSAQTVDQECETCGMTVDTMGQVRFKILDATGARHYACCPICALKLVKTYGELNISSFCDMNGPNYPITIAARNYGSVVTISPTSALILMAGSCTKNRIVYNSAAADALLAPPRNGTSSWLSPMTNSTVQANATRIGLAEAVLQQGGGITSPCEKCGMDVNPTGQARFRIVDTNGTTHIACCPMCALKLLNNTNGELNITSYCDYYGPSYPIKISIKAYGNQVQVIPSTALIINGGSCTKNRIVYNSSAADALLAPPNDGTSQWLPSNTNATVLANATRMTISQAALTYGVPEFSAAAMILVFASVVAFVVFATKRHRRTIAVK
jgi:hypothetical protein